jgi:tight adherence protein C
MLLVTVVAGLAAAGAVLLVMLGLQNRSDGAIRERLAAYAPDPVAVSSTPLEDLEMARPFRDRVLVPLTNKIAMVTKHLSPGNTLDKTEQKLAQAGNPHGINVESFYGLKGVVAVAFTVVVTIFMYFNPYSGVVPYPPQVPVSALVWGLIALVLGFFFPDMWLRDELKRRQKRISRAMPDTIDIIAISVEAGLGFDAACQRVASKSKDDLAFEFDRYLLELRLGKSRREALRNIIWRTGVPDLSQFITAIIQADQLGVSIANVLRIQSAQMRMRRRQRAEAQAQKAPLKMLFPMALFIFPSIFVVILGPVVPSLMHSL